MSQIDLFACEAPAAAETYRPDPALVRARMGRIIQQLGSRDARPWEPTRLNLFRAIVPDMISRLPPQEAARLRHEFEVAIAHAEGQRAQH